MFKRAFTHPRKSSSIAGVIERLPYDPETDPFMIAIRAIREAQRARGHVPRTREEIDAELKEMDEQDEEHSRRIEKIHEEAVAAVVRQGDHGDGTQAAH